MLLKTVYMNTPEFGNFGISTDVVPTMIVKEKWVIKLLIDKIESDNKLIVFVKYMVQL